MRIAQVSTLATPVAGTGSGSVEGLVWLLSRELTARGHEVVVFASAGSEPYGELVATVAAPYSHPGSFDDWQVAEWVNLCRAVEQSARFDVLHSHAYLWGLPLEPLARAPMVHTMHVLPGDDQAALWAMTPDACVTAISRFQWSAYPDRRPAAVVPHGVDPARFTLREDPEDYVCYLGQFTPGKGPIEAIGVARELGMRLLLAGPESPYFSAAVEPLVDGRSVEYLGFLAGAERDRLLGGARALLYPIQYPEPFGLVQVEAMMCGTPVVAMRHGAVPEIVDDGLTGYGADSAEEFGRRVLDSFSLDRRRVRERAEQRFSADRMACQYLEIYERQAAQWDAAGHSPSRRSDAGTVTARWPHGTEPEARGR